MPTDVTAQWTQEGLRVSWTYDSKLVNVYSDDRTLLALKQADGPLVFMETSGAKRSNGTDFIEIPDGLSLTGKWHCWLAFVSEDRKRVSDSVYIELEGFSSLLVIGYGYFLDGLKRFLIA